MLILNHEDDLGRMIVMRINGVVMNGRNNRTMKKWKQAIIIDADQELQTLLEMYKQDGDDLVCHMHEFSPS